MNTKIINDDWITGLKTLDNATAHCVVTSPPYWGLRDYGVPGQLGLERTPEEYVAKMVEGFREVRRVLRPDGTCWLNLGDSYASTPAGNRDETFSLKQASNSGSTIRRTRSTICEGFKSKELVGIPWMVAFALRADGWYLRQDIIWAKPNPMPESVTDRCTRSHEYLFLLTKNAKYYYDANAIKEDCVKPEDGKRNKRDVWTIASQPYKGAHFATFPMSLVEPCVLAGCPFDGIVLDPFCGSGTVGAVAKKLGRNFIGIELNAEYLPLIEDRIMQQNTGTV